MAGIPISTRAPSESADTLAPPLGPEIKMCQKTDGTCHTACNLDKKYPDIPLQTMKSTTSTISFGMDSDRERRDGDRDRDSGRPRQG